MKIAVASDHAGFESKKTVVAWLEKHGYACSDMARIMKSLSTTRILPVKLHKGLQQVSLIRVFCSVAPASEFP